MTATGTEARVCQDIADRQAKGLQKYGTTVEGNPLGVVRWLRHAYEECLDQAVYLRRCIEVLEGFPIEIKGGGGAGWSGSMAESLVAAQSTTLEDGSTLTATGPVQNDPHAELRQTWKPGQVWQVNCKGTIFDWINVSGIPEWSPKLEYRRHPDYQDAEDASKPVEEEWIKWSGGLPPIDLGGKVQVRLRNGGLEDGKPADFEWDRAGFPSDIVAYRRAE